MRAGLVLAACLLLAALPAWAQDELTGTLKKLRDSGTITLGYRESSLPFSYVTAGGTPIGYALDLCREVADDAAAELGVPELRIALKPVTPEDRIQKLVSGDIDLECGSTTNNVERQQQVAFSPITFVAGTKLLVPRASPVQSYRDLAGKTVVVTVGTTNEAAVKKLSDRQHLGIRFVTTPDHAQSYALLASGGADAFATDDVLLYGFVATAKNGAAFHVVGDYLSYEPYGLMYRRDDPAFATVVQASFARMADAGILRDDYNRWFTKRLPTGETLNLPMSPQLAEIFRLLGQPD
ncbi:amino acid ABC transporter substrate-binding protein [Limobrevibacterium gyesilva]|uniref:Amino acid ABC transporter substrate-binding protein n=1 Tax=Limobrevibacterium gyesilva TaxID=2991712 RepID=A0AA41YJL3_9PROT|nr:amino acid ABC transporter substrate-binding protein [Limobrevibacterium gyesilva]MCW3474384.1 amino acid ABC transporter substrate-binding protein [Limobrevibacterium gyesilva]